MGSSNSYTHWSLFICSEKSFNDNIIKCLSPKNVESSLYCSRCDLSKGFIERSQIKQFRCLNNWISNYLIDCRLFKISKESGSLVLAEFALVAGVTLARGVLSVHRCSTGRRRRLSWYIPDHTYVKYQIHHPKYQIHQPKYHIHIHKLQIHQTKCHICHPNAKEKTFQNLSKVYIERWQMFNTGGDAATSMPYSRSHICQIYFQIPKIQHISMRYAYQHTSHI